MNQQIQIQKESKEQRMLGKAECLVKNRRVRRSSCAESRNLWMVSSYSTPKKWYVVRWNEELSMFTCACKAFEYSSDNRCLHIAACAIIEGNGDI